MPDLLKRLLLALRSLLHFILGESIRLLVPRTPESGTLVLRLDALGDFILWLSSGASCIAGLARSEGRSVLVANSDWAEFASELRLFDEVWPLEVRRFRREPLYRLRFLARLRSRGFARIIQPRSAREFLLEDLIVRAAGAVRTTTPSGSHANLNPPLKRITDAWYTDLLPTPAHATQELEINAAFARALCRTEPAAVTLGFTDHLADRFGIDSKYFVIAPGAGMTGKTWPVEHFAEVALRLHRLTGWACVVVGSQKERGLGEPLQRALGSACSNLAGKTSLMELGMVLRFAQLAISNDSAVAHFAPLVGTRGVSILGGGHFGWFLPYPHPLASGVRPTAVFRKMDCFGCNWRCCYKVARNAPFPCIEQVPANDVWEAVRQMATAS